MIVLDTHVLIWWVNGEKQLSAKAQKAIDQALAGDSKIMISSISTWEIAMLVSKGRLTLSMDLDSWLETVAAIDGVVFVPLENRIALESVRLPGEFHADPADRIIVALARHYAVPLLTADNKIHAYPHVKTIG